MKHRALKELKTEELRKLNGGDLTWGEMWDFVVEQMTVEDQVEKKRLPLRERMGVHR